MRLTDLMADTIACHGLQWAVTFYAARIPRFELRVLLRSVYVNGNGMAPAPAPVVAPTYRPITLDEARELIRATFCTGSAL